MYVIEIEPKEEVNNEYATPTYYHFDRTHFMWEFLDFVIKNGKDISVRITTSEQE